MKEGHGWLTIYLQDHYAGAVAGTALFHRVAGSHRDPGVRRIVRDLASEVEHDRRELNKIMKNLTIPHDRTKEYLAWAGEKLGRFVTNGTVLRRSPLTDVVELEALSLAVEGKALGWKAMLALAESEPGLEANQIQVLLDRAYLQRSRLEELRLARAVETFGPAGPSRNPRGGFSVR
jgi:hypothetical protein